MSCGFFLADFVCVCHVKEDIWSICTFLCPPQTVSDIQRNVTVIPQLHTVIKQKITNTSSCLKIIKSFSIIFTLIHFHLMGRGVFTTIL